ncbi:hypothetical protein ACIPC2_03450 [Curtobacterium pusillum]|uniref:5-methylcytosine restriction system specificity protein McrC n=1 Tax=Curtobacterium pusillum TaxID=69373 RepID=UPI003818883F
MHETELAAIRTSAACIGSLAMSLADAVRSQSDLLALGSPSDGPLREQITAGEPFRQLVDLMLLAERGSMMDSPLAFEGAHAPSMLQLLTHERLLATVERLLFRVRPRYDERTEILEMPRGKLGAESLLFSLATGTPRVESTYDELTTDTSLLQVVASALRVIGSSRLPPKVAALRPGLQTRAAHLLRHLSGVTPIERHRAILLAESLWLGPLDRIWKPAVDAALPVLRDWAVEPEAGESATDALLIHVSTEKFWEQCLEVALESTFSTLAVSRDARTGEGVSVPAPWVPSTAEPDHSDDHSTRSFPDFVLRSGQRIVVADAKYKLGTGLAPASSDGYQLFAYSHLATLDGRLSDLAVLLYPTGADARARQVELRQLWDRRYPLWLAHLPFPDPIDLREQQNWSVYIASLTSQLRSFSKEWARA